ncbi:MAG: hypothetical protein A2086_15215 [Spirochaetes bacterium GWD1_27_9]|nr:MAG: hypothetical protein A2Y34_02365 [Spirochaetes bacterium GWC1_27_15]OHD45111.1 MAG: hypothetical protein A2086_15215 [Spirochaetes bacterium GWD1_27_9]
MLIANPIYDVVFKYLMEDLDIAKEIIGAIIDKEIISLTLKPQEKSLEYSVEKSQEDKNKPKDSVYNYMRLYRIDFNAVIKDKEGEYQNVIIEIQKSPIKSALMRFRNYLAEKYKQEEIILSEQGKEIKKPLPIITIYFLGFELENTLLPEVIEISRNYKNILTGEIINSKDEFIECLTHNSFIIQIPKLHPTMKTKLEKILSIFDQSEKTDRNFVINYEYEPEDEIMEKIVRRLLKAASDPKVRDEIELEEEADDVFKQLEEKDKAIEEKNKTIEQKDKAIEEKEKTIEQKDKTIEEKDRIIKELLDKLK